MREMCIETGKPVFNPGEYVEGHVILRCDDGFKCNRVTIHLQGEEKSRVVRGSGDNRRVYREKITHVSQVVELITGAPIESGEHHYPFRIRLPVQIPGSYQGVHGRVRYQLRAKTEISWAFDLKSSIPINVSHRVPILSPRAKTAQILQDGQDMVRIEIPEDLVRYDEPFTFRYHIQGDPNMRGIRAELLYIERVAPRGVKAKARRKFLEHLTKKEELTGKHWHNLSFMFSSRWPAAFHSSLIHASYFLRIVVDIPWRLDEEAMIPIRFSGKERFVPSGEDYESLSKRYRIVFGDE